MKLDSKRIIVKIDKWVPESKYPFGHLVKILGSEGDTATESLLILHEYNVITKPFSQRILECLPTEVMAGQFPKKKSSKDVTWEISVFAPSTLQVAKTLMMRYIAIEWRMEISMLGCILPMWPILWSLNQSWTGRLQGDAQQCTWWIGGLICFQGCLQRICALWGTMVRD